MKKTSKNSRDREQEGDRNFRETLGLWPDKNKNRDLSDDEKFLRDAVRGHDNL
jgi:ribonuclease I